MTTNTPATFLAAPRVGDFEHTVNLLALLGEANRQLAELKAQIESGYVALVNAHREKYAKLQSTISETEGGLEVIARRNPQWFDDKKNVSTPYGAVKFKSSKELVIADENISVQLVLALSGKDGAEKFLRTVRLLNKEALSELTDAELARFAIVRKAKENFSVDTDVVDLGKAVKSIEKSEKNAAKAAKKAAAAAGAE